MASFTLKEDFLVGLGLGVAAQDQGASIGGWEVNIEHLDGGELVEDGARSQPRSQRTQTGTQSHVQAVGQKRDKDMGFDAILAPMEDGTQTEIVLKAFEDGFNFDQLDVEASSTGSRLQRLVRSR